MVLVNACRTTRIYCRPNCPPGRRTKPENRAHFASREAARRAGYRACKVCKPDEREYGEWTDARRRKPLTAADPLAPAAPQPGWTPPC
ncbi:MAG: hypothetical protein FJ315_05345 [SAR202 cluster bacterium]|nr:hypothetical protein [SAR202 cluster bacterium]